jgi:hypothetical protein
MKLPKTFVPEKDLDNKLEQLLKEKKEFSNLNDDDHDQIYKKLFGYLCNYLNAKTTDWKGILYINDHSEKNKYELVKNMLKDMADNKLSMPYNSYNWRLLNFFGNPRDEDLFYKLYQAILYEKLDESSMCIVYTSNHMTDELAKDVTKWQMLMANTVICPLSEPEE